VRWLIVPLLAVVTTLATTTTAEGSPNAVNGYGDTVTDDWGDNPEICWGCNFSHNTNIVGLWQHILYADGLMGVSDVDCQFGPRTDDATRRWQSRHGVAMDGRVGRNTWGRADDKLAWSHDGFYVYYHGSQHPVRLFRGQRGGTGGDYWIHYWNADRGVTDSTIVYFDRSTASFCA
jgi:hypothetical protein